MLNKKGFFNLTHKAMQDLSNYVNCESKRRSKAGNISWEKFLEIAFGYPKASCRDREKNKIGKYASWIVE